MNLQKIVTTYPRVYVTDAPGYADFAGYLLMELDRIDGVPMSLVAYEWGGVTEFDIFQSRYVSEA